MLTTLAISNYRSLRNLIVPLRRLNLITGPNGSGKSSVYRALRLLAETAQGGVIPSLAREGGLQSTLWAGPEMLGRAVKRGEHKVEGTVRKERTNLRLGLQEMSLVTRSTWAFLHQAGRRLRAIRKSRRRRFGPARSCGLPLC